MMPREGGGPVTGRASFDPASCAETLSTSLAGSNATIYSTLLATTPVAIKILVYASARGQESTQDPLNSIISYSICPVSKL